MKRQMFAGIMLSFSIISGIALGQSMDFVGSVALPNGANAIVVSGNYAYIANNEFGLQIVNVYDPANPVVAGNIDTPGWASDVFVSGNYAYVADYSSMQIINISNPANPALVGSFDCTRECFGVCVINNYAYLANGDLGMRKLDVSDPAIPIELGSITVAGEIHDLVVQGNYAFVVSNIVEPYMPFLWAIDISDMQIIGMANSMSGLWALDIKIAGQYVFMAVNGAGLQIYDVSNPASPQRLENNNPYGVNNVFIDGYHAFTADGYTGIHMINIFDLHQIKPLCGYDTPGSALGICYADSFIYVADNSSLQIFHLSGACHYVVGDINESGRFNGLDVVYAVGWLAGTLLDGYSCECPPPNAWHVAGDANGSCSFNGLDVTYAVNYFKGGPAPMPCQNCPPAEISDR